MIFIACKIHHNLIEFIGWHIIANDRLRIRNYGCNKQIELFQLLLDSLIERIDILLDSREPRHFR